MKPRIPTIRYRCPVTEGAPPMGTILMGSGPRVRRAYRILTAKQVRSSIAALGVCTWKLQVEPMSAERGREEIASGVPWWEICWDRRKRRGA